MTRPIYKNLTFQIMVLAACLPTSTIAAKPSKYTSERTLVSDLIRRGDFDRSIDHLLLIEYEDDDTADRAAATIIAARIYEKSLKIETSIKTIQLALDREKFPVGSLEFVGMRREQSRLYLKLKQFNVAQRLLKESGTPVLQVPNYDDGYTPVFYRNPHVVASASTFIPGLGQAMIGRPQDILTSWIMIGLPLWINFEARKNGERALALASGTVAGFFYLGNIASAYRLAQKDVATKRDKSWSEKVDILIAPQYREAAKILGISFEARAMLD